jgi:hypothetical protein
MGATCVPVQTYGAWGGHVYGFRLNNMNGLKFQGHSFPAAEMRVKGSMAVKNACLLALGFAEAGNDTVSDSSFAIASGMMSSYWQSGEEPYHADKDWASSFSVAPTTSQATTYLQCYFNTAKAFNLADRLKPDAPCECKCTAHPCCWSVGYTLKNEELHGNRKGVDSAQECCNHCTNHPQCTSWVYWPGTFFDQCVLHQGTPAWQAKAMRHTQFGNEIPPPVAGTRSGGAQCIS